jgi:hypothetical protein
LLLVWVGIVASLAAGLGLARSAGRSHDRGGAVGSLTPAERKALRVASVKVAGGEPVGIAVTVTFGGDLQKAIGRGDLKNAAVALILEPKSSNLASAGLVTQGAGAVGQTLRRTRSTRVGVLREGKTFIFLIRGPGASGVGKILVRTFVRGPSANARKTQSLSKGGEPPPVIPPSQWASFESQIAWSSMFVSPNLEELSCDSLPGFKRDAQGIVKRAEQRATALNADETAIKDAIYAIEHGEANSAEKLRALYLSVGPAIVNEIGLAPPVTLTKESLLEKLKEADGALTKLLARNKWLSASAANLVHDIDVEIEARCSGNTPPPQFNVTILSKGYDHTVPGQSGDPSTVCVDFGTDPPQPGLAWRTEMGVGTKVRYANGRLDSQGHGRVVYGIPQAGPYTITIYVIISPGDTKKAEADIDVPQPPPSGKSKDCSAPPPPA